jgi:hypothetical protein
LSNIVIVPKQPSQVFGSLFEIQSGPDEILVSGATVDDIEIVTAITAAEIGAPLASIVNSIPNAVNGGSTTVSSSGSSSGGVY